MIVGSSFTGDSVIFGSSFKGEPDGESTNTGESISSGESIGVGEFTGWGESMVAGESIGVRESTGSGDSTGSGESTVVGESIVTGESTCSDESIRSGEPTFSPSSSSIARFANFTVASELAVSVNLLFLISTGSAEIGESVIIPLPS